MQRFVRALSALCLGCLAPPEKWEKVVKSAGIEGK